MNENDAELQFINDIFCERRNLLLKEYRGIYDVLLEQYKRVYLDGKSKGMDAMTIWDKFIRHFSLKIL